MTAVPVLVLALLTGLDDAAGAGAGVEDDPRGAPRIDGPQPLVARTFVPVAELTYDPGDLEPSLVKGEPQNPKEFSSVFYSTDSAGRACTATAVGKRVVLTAAHCVDDGGAIEIVVAGRTNRLLCSQAPEYRTDRTADWALCLAANPLAVTRPERVAPGPTQLRKDTAVVLTGFGCTERDGGGGGDGVFRAARARVVRTPPREFNYLETDFGASICFGDSGGPTFLQLGPTIAYRVQVAVNSRAEELGEGRLGTRSYLSSILTSEARQFLVEWSGKNAVPICGISEDPGSCE